eukprot:CAMPEP_0198209970 /NCGR_PEP_ID=MMETSP1445-20131203/17935_1 /TAXON_ID=36898 /ORGANISM="Pyramimonas sp., Strain CCMP2087" /LENGTH=181 /DNA_ID=CAMNT_0043883895 /DNA_START=83 /DNA_END=628 /DNA_ORIENTATION=+
MASVKAAPEHPKYDVMIKSALLSLKDRTGSSVVAIAKFLGATYNLPANFKKTMSTQLKNMTKAGKLEKVKASFKLTEAFKKPVKAKKVKAPKKVVTKKAKAPKKVTAKKVTPKKAPKKAVTKKSVAAPKSPAVAAVKKAVIKKTAVKKAVAPKKVKKAAAPKKASTVSTPKKAKASKAKKA